MSLRQSWPLERGAPWTRRRPAPVLHSSRLEVYLPDSKFSGSGADRCTPRGRSRVQGAPHRASGSPFCPRTLQSALAPPLACRHTGRGGPGGAAFPGTVGPPQLHSPRGANASHLGHSQVLELGQSRGACPLLSLLVPPPPCPSLGLPVQPACYLPPLPRAPPPSSFHCPPSGPTLCLRPLATPIAAFTPFPQEHPGSSVPLLPAPGSPPRLRQPCGLLIPLDPSSLVPTPEHTGK